MTSQNMKLLCRDQHSCPSVMHEEVTARRAPDSRPKSCPPPFIDGMQFEIIARCSTTRARVSRMTLARQHLFLCDAACTDSALSQTGLLCCPRLCLSLLKLLSKGRSRRINVVLKLFDFCLSLTSQQTEELGITLLLNNTYHLNLRPGTKVLDAAPGAHTFQGWRKNILTVRCPSRFGYYDSDATAQDTQDSGGFQMVSLSSFREVTEEGVLFSSPFTGEPTMLTVCNIFGRKGGLSADSNGSQRSP